MAKFHPPSTWVIAVLAAVLLWPGTARSADPPLPLPPAGPSTVFIHGFRVQLFGPADRPELRLAVEQALGTPDWYFSPATLPAWLLAARQRLAMAGYPNVELDVHDGTVHAAVLTVDASFGPVVSVEAHSRREKPRQSQPFDAYVQQRIARATTRSADPVSLNTELAWLARSPALDPSSPPTLTVTQDPDSDVVTIKALYTEAPRFDGAVGFDNDRPPSVGSEAVDVYGTARDLLRPGDSASIRYAALVGGLSDMRFAQLDDFAVSYDVPPFIGSDTHVRVGYVRSNLPVVDQSLAGLDIRSRSEDASVLLGRPFHLSRSVSFGLDAGFDLRTDHTALLGEPVGFVPSLAGGDSQVTAVQVGQSVDYVGDLGRATVRSSFDVGLPILGSTSQPGDLPDGRFVVWRLDGGYRKLLPGTTVELVGRVSVQLATDRLLAVEQFSLGGADSVRGYREQLLLRDNGVAGSAEARVPVLARGGRFPVSVRLAPFADVGYGWDHDGAGHQPVLASAGIGVLVDLCDHVHGSLYWGHPFEHFTFVHRDLQDDGIHFSVSCSLEGP